MQPADAFPLPHRFTRDEYHRIAEMQLFLDERVELLDGVIVSMSPQRSAHRSEGVASEGHTVSIPNGGTLAVTDILPPS